jgi:hypothetical protein
VLPRTGQGKGYIPGAILVDGEIVGSWQRQRRNVVLHPFEELPAAIRELIEREAISFPIPRGSAATVGWA